MRQNFIGHNVCKVYIFETAGDLEWTDSVTEKPKS